MDLQQLRTGTRGPGVQSPAVPGQGAWKLLGQHRPCRWALQAAQGWSDQATTPQELCRAEHTFQEWAH